MKSQMGDHGCGFDNLVAGVLSFYKRPTTSMQVHKDKSIMRFDSHVAHLRSHKACPCLWLARCGVAILAVARIATPQGQGSHPFSVAPPRVCQGITCKQTISEAVSIKAARARRQPHVCFDGRAVAGAGASSTGRRCNHPGGTPLQSLNWRAAGGQHTCV